MEIILLISALAASPFIGSVFDKPTRKRMAKGLYAWLQSEEKAAPRTMAECLALVPRNKDWGADKKLQKLWDDALAWYSVENRDEVLKRALELRAENELKLRVHRRAVANLEEEMEHLVHTYWHSERDYDTLSELRVLLRKEEDKAKKTYTDDDLVVLALNDAYDWGMYGNDLIHMVKKDLPRLDFIAVAR